MKILMIRPRPSPETIGLQHLMIVEPLELEVLYALKREEDEAVIVDLILEKKPVEYFIKREAPDILCLTGYITNVSTIIDYCRLAKTINPRIITIVGGVHCEVCPEDFMDESVDYRVFRNAAVIFTDLLNHIAGISEMPQGVLARNQEMADVALPPFNFNIPFPARSSVTKYSHKYFYIFHQKVRLLKTSFGCPFQCSFCFCRIITEGKFQQRPLQDVITEIESLKEKEIYIVDDDFLLDRAWLRSFISEVKTRNIKKHYLVYGRADFIANNPDIIHELAEIGLRTVIVGFESFSDEELHTYNKKTSVAMYRRTMEILNRERIDVFATIIIPPHWDRTDFKHMVSVLKSLKIHFVNLQPLTPMPKTKISFPAERIILNKKDYDQWDLAHISVMPDKLSVPDFYREILKAYSALLYSPAVIWTYLTTYNPRMLLKMLVGGYRVTKQYKKKIKEATAHA